VHIIRFLNYNAAEFVHVLCPWIREPVLSAVYVIKTFYKGLWQGLIHYNMIIYVAKCVLKYAYVFKILWTEFTAAIGCHATEFILTLFLSILAAVGI